MQAACSADGAGQPSSPPSATTAAARAAARAAVTAAHAASGLAWGAGRSEAARTLRAAEAAATAALQLLEDGASPSRQPRGGRGAGAAPTRRGGRRLRRRGGGSDGDSGSPPTLGAADSLSTWYDHPAGSAAEASGADGPAASARHPVGGAELTESEKEDARGEETPSLAQPRLSRAALEAAAEADARRAFITHMRQFSPGGISTTVPSASSSSRAASSWVEEEEGAAAAAAEGASKASTAADGEESESIVPVLHHNDVEAAANWKAFRGKVVWLHEGLGCGVQCPEFPLAINCIEKEFSGEEPRVGGDVSLYVGVITKERQFHPCQSAEQLGELLVRHTDSLTYAKHLVVL